MIVQINCDNAGKQSAKEGPRMGSQLVFVDEGERSQKNLSRACIICGES